MESISILAVLALVFSCTLALDVTLNQHWNLWKQTNNKQYSDAEEHVRRNIWESNLKIVQDHNFDADLGLHTYWLGMNKYADLTIDEFVKVMNGFNATMQGPQTHSRNTYTFDPSLKLPDIVDWRDKGYVTPVKDQGQCGSCWAFSATGSLEGQNFRVTSKLVSLSEQNLVDCSRQQGNFGCSGGLMDRAFEYIEVNNGIDTETSYPYEHVEGQCRFTRADVGATDTGFTNIKKKDEDALQQAVAIVGPISAAIDASHSSFQLYKQGIYDEHKCSSTQLDHGVLVVGYGAEGNKDYWIVKNSWGADWGDQGYIQMSRKKFNQCGIATLASFPTV